MGGLITGSLLGVERAGRIVTTPHQIENAIVADFTVTLGGATIGMLYWDPMHKVRDAIKDAEREKSSSG